MLNRMIEYQLLNAKKQNSGLFIIFYKLNIKFN